MGSTKYLLLGLLGSSAFLSDSFQPPVDPGSRPVDVGTHGDKPQSRRVLLSNMAAATVGGAVWHAGVVQKDHAFALDVDPTGYNEQNERIFDTRRKSYLPVRSASLMRTADLSSPVVCLGEVHSHPVHHAMQFRVMKAVAEMDDRPLSIGLEMFYKGHQAALDRYVFQHGNMHALKYETKWSKTWGWDFNHYAKIFNYARLHGVRLVGLNAPRELFSLIAQKGLDGLPDNLKAAMPEVDLSNPRHFARFKETMKPLEAFHGPMSAEVLKRFYEAQTTWDEHMAEGVAHHLTKHGGKMVVLAGVGHIENRDGLPDRVERRTGVKPFTVVPRSVAWSDGLPEIDSPPGVDYGDWIWFTENEIPKPKRVIVKA